ncbi:MAG: toxin-antitoxin system YwqK family antitoxin [Flavobacteriales bacterium]
MIQNWKYKILILFLSVCFFTSYSQDSTKFTTYYYPSGIKSSEGYITNGKPDKYWKTYYENGKIRTEGNRKNFELDSVWKFYDESGKLNSSIEYKNGKKNGWKITYDSLPVSKEYFINDEKEGFSYTYYPSGKLKSEFWFEKGKQNGKAYKYSELSDTLIQEISYYKGGILQKKESINAFDASGKKQDVWKWFYPNKTIKGEGFYNNDLLNGYYRSYDASGNLKEIAKYENGVKIENAPELAKAEVKKEYYPNMKVKSAGAYVNGKKEGMHKFFDEQGNVTATKIYKDDLEVGSGIISSSGVKNGEWKEYYDDHQLKVSGHFKYDVKVGKWIYYYSNGKVEQQGEYNSKGLPDGEWKWYYDSGKLLREETYDNGLEEGTTTEYSEDGKIVIKGAYVQGLKEGQWLYEMGVYKEVGSYKNDLREGMWKHIYTDTGKPRFEGAFQMGNAVGTHKYYYPSGALKSEGPYVGGMKNGEWKYFSEAGEIEKIIIFRSDEEYKINGLKVNPEEKKDEGEKK